MTTGSGASAEPGAEGRGRLARAARRTGQPAEEPTGPDAVDVTAGTRSVRRRGARALVAALVAFLLGAAVGAAVPLSRPAVWSSTTTLAIDQPLVVSASRDAGPIEKLSRLRLQYAGLLRTQTIAGPVAARTGLTSSQVAASVAAEVPPTSLLVLVSATGDTADGAQELSAEAAQELIDFAAENQARAGVPLPERVVLAVATPAVPAVEVGPGLRTTVTVALFLGTVTAAAAWLLATQLGRSRRR